ncbi:sigma-70 family RNA polymerase sigma factor [Brevibacillus laterosporus]|uniref:RNA polymerase sigma70 factor n=1 Tax=Brevibacillus laterosporus TaxID=1465 RepID=A0A0F7EJQ0_BRELA|nr:MULTISPECIES: sigma-70 family RNA polymerase sigma factor [Brevibacillus]AKF96173.1 RNA polymerase sigma70 factor [Brevibacillus laterosporus]GIN99677.1 RNA polymerase sigma factor SigV [Brevibacillus halotolerans]
MHTHTPNHSTEKIDHLYTLIEENKDPLYRLAYSFVKNRDEALDIVQDTIYKAITSIDSVRKPEFLKSWLYRIAINSAHNSLRKTRRIVSMDMSILENVRHHSDKNRDQIFDVRQALEKLDLKYKTVIILRFFEDMTLESVAEILDIPVSTVKTRLYRGLQKLKIDLQEVENLEKSIK